MPELSGFNALFHMLTETETAEKTTLMAEFLEYTVLKGENQIYLLVSVKRTNCVKVLMSSGMRRDLLTLLV